MLKGTKGTSLDSFVRWLSQLWHVETGLNLLELAITMALVGLLVPVLIRFQFQTSAIPVQMATDLTMVAQSRKSSALLSDDVRYGQVFVPGIDNDYGAFEAADYTIASPEIKSAQYSYDPVSQSLVREIEVTGVLEEQLSIVSNVAQAQDISMAQDAGIVAVEVNQTADVPLGAQSLSLMLVQNLEVAGPILDIPGEPPSIEPLALCASDGLTIQGSDNQVIGDVTVGGDASVRGVNNAVMGTLLAGNPPDLAGVGNTISTAIAGNGSCALEMDPDAFRPFRFVFSGDASLKEYPAVWTDSNKRNLLPGVYFAEGTLTVDGHGVTGEVTLIARKIVVAGTLIELSPARGGLLVLALGSDGSTAIEIDGGGNRLTGVLFAAAGNVSLGGSEGAYDGSILVPQGDANLTGSRNQVYLNQGHFDSALAMGEASSDLSVIPSPAPLPTPTPRSTPVATATATSTSTPTATPIPTPTPAPTPTPTAMAVPTNTPIPTPTPTPAPTVTSTPAPSLSMSILGASGDSYVVQDGAASNYGSGTTMVVQSRGGARNRRIFVGFDLSDIPAGASVQSATLRLYRTAGSGTERTYEVRRVLEDWTETGVLGVTWANQPAVSEMPADTAVVRSPDGFKTWDVTADVQAFLSGTASNFGWRVSDQSESSSTNYNTTFATRENATPANRPELVVSYTLP